MSDENETILLVYVGARIGRGDKVIHLWLEVSQRQADEGLIPTTVESADEYRTYTGKAAVRRMTGAVGSIYAVEQVKGTKQVYGGAAKYVGLWPDDDQRLLWQADSRTAVTTAELRRRKDKEGAADLFSPLAPLRERYGRLIGQDRQAALLAQIIAYITRG